MKIKFFLALLYINVCFASESAENARRHEFARIIDDCYDWCEAFTNPASSSYLPVNTKSTLPDSVKVTRYTCHYYNKETIEVSPIYISRSGFDLNSSIPFELNPAIFGNTPLAALITFFTRLPPTHYQEFVCVRPGEPSTSYTTYHYNKASGIASFSRKTQSAEIPPK